MGCGRTVLSKLTADEVAFLQLFSFKPAASEQYEHPRLKSAVYDSRQRLIENGILAKDEGGHLAQYQERVRLRPDAIEAVENLIINGKIQRDSVLLDLDNVDATGASGSGAPPYTNSTR
jgi:hypothetical protein